MNALEWRAIPHWPEYEASSMGNIRRIMPGRGARVGHVLKAWLTNKGYLMVSLCRGSVEKHVTVRTIVAAAFIGHRPIGFIVLHADGSRTHNVPSNLRYGTYVENSADAERHGRVSRGERHGARVKAGRWPGAFA